MKKFFLVVGFVLIFVSISMQRDAFLTINLKDATLTAYYNGFETVSVYSKTDYSMEDLNAYALRIDAKNEGSTLNTVQHHLGLKQVLTQKLDDITIYYKYSYFLPKVRYKDGKKYNIMIAIIKDKIVIGYPIIAGSY